MARRTKKKEKLAKRISKFSKKASTNSREHIQENLIGRFSHIKMIRIYILEWALLVGAIILLSITQAFWYASSYTTDSWDEGGVYTEATLGKINSLNPLFATTESEKTLSKLMFATLSSPDYSGHTGLDLAASITTGDSGLVWTVLLKDGLKWSDGEAITNQDVLFTVSLLQNESINSTYSSNLSGIEVKEEDGALKFTLPAAYSSFSSALNFPILPEHILKDIQPSLLLEHNFSISPVTSGPFVYNAAQNIGNDGEKIVYLTPNESYYKGAPLIDSFVVHAFLEKDDIIDALNSGSVTATADLSPLDADQITSDSIYEKQSAISSGVLAFLNTSDGVFANKDLRKALQKGIDKRSLRAPLGDEQALDYPILSSQVNINEYPELPEYDPDSAKSTIAEKYSTEDTVRLVTVNSGYLPALAENLKYQLEQLGFNVDLTTYDAGQDFLLTVLRPRDYDILIYEIEFGADPDLFAYYHSSQATQTGLNLSNYKNSIVSDLLLAARSTMDTELRTAKYESFLKYWVEDAPAICIYQVNMSYYVNKNVRSYSEDNRLVTALDRFTDVNFWATEKAIKNRTP